jgi:hypothetical protein
MLFEESFAEKMSRWIRSAFLLTLVFLVGFADGTNAGDKSRWIDRPQDQWPQITMINQIEYTDTSFPIAGCSFLLDTGEDTLAVTAKHVLTYFKSKDMKSVSFGNTLESWKMFPKDNENDVVIVDRLINEDKKESIDDVSSPVDWLLFSIQSKSANIQPLRFRDAPLVEGDRVYIIGWRYSDKACAQRVYEGNYVKSSPGTVLISTKELADNKMPGLSGSPVIDSNGDLIGIMSRKAGKMEQLSSADYPRKVLKRGSDKTSN